MFREIICKNGGVVKCVEIIPDCKAKIPQGVADLFTSKTSIELEQEFITMNKTYHKKPRKS